MTASVRVLRTYTDVQMAAEAIDLANNQAGNELRAVLMNGNNRASKFTEAQATAFSQEWRVVAHQRNTSTGFSGTLFEYIGQSDPERGLTNGQLVLSFRSTEFIDDNLRDNQATNALEVTEFGWAFGQIADMEDWYQSLKSNGSIPDGQSLTVTGYSLGGHLATAFNILRREDGTANNISATYTFNGAGVGNFLAPSLTSVMQEFQALRASPSNVTFVKPALKALFENLALELDGEKTEITDSQFAAFKSSIWEADSEQNTLQAQELWRAYLGCSRDNRRAGQLRAAESMDQRSVRNGSYA